MSPRVSMLVLSVVLTVNVCRAFKAAVYEHVQLHDAPSRADVIAINVARYVEVVQEAGRKQMDIIVFPEGGLMFGMITSGELSKYAEDIPDPGANPCHSENKAHFPVLANLSCAAQSNHIYVVANFYDKKPCQPGKPCPSDKTLYYNTNVAFDRNGTIVSRYHKNHLFGEFWLTTPDPPEFAVFDTDFGARVGMFICFDVLFKEASEIVSRFNVTLGVMSSWWFDKLPGWYSVAVQQGWSLRHGVPLLASGIQQPKLGSAGSGIYSGADGPRAYTYSPDFQPKLLAVDFQDEVPANPRYHKDVLNPRERKLKQLNARGYAIQQLHGNSGKKKVCDGDFCCHVEYETASLNDKFFVLAKNGFRRVSYIVDMAMQECIVAVCHSNIFRPCASFSTSSTTTFTKFQLHAQFKTADVFSTLSSNELALTPKRSWSVETSSTNVTTLAVNVDSPPVEPLLQATLFARLFDQDKPQSGPSKVMSFFRELKHFLG